MIEKWLSSNDIAKLVSRTPQWIRKKSRDGGWPYRSYAVRGGQERRYHIKDLPEDIQAAYAASLNLDLEALKGELKPPAKVETRGSTYGLFSRPPEL